MLHLNKTIRIQQLNAPWLQQTEAHVLRLDELHPVVSGNKWFKLQFHVENMLLQHKKIMGTFGGAYSNHIVAAAYVAKSAGLQSIGIIRGEEPKQYAATLLQAKDLGMQLHFVSREAYLQKTMLQQQFANTDAIYWINEGGYSVEGMKGAATILQQANTTSFTHIICACGTGTMMAGLIVAALPQQKVIGISVLKGHTNLEQQIQQLLPVQKKFALFHDYHFGGYAKHPPALIEWMKTIWYDCDLPTDIVYTSKLLFAVKDLIEKKYFTANDKILIIHSGGLQGNRSLAPHILPF